MNTTTNTVELTPDTKWDDPYFVDPSAPRWIFFDDEKPNEEEREKRLEAIRLEEEAAAMREYPYFHKESGLYRDDPDCPAYNPRVKQWVDPKYLEYNERMEADRYEIWLQEWYDRNQPDHREEFMANIIGLELDPNSFLSVLKDGLKEHLNAPQIESVWEKLSIYKAIRDILKKPVVASTQVTTRKLTKTYTSKMRYFPDDYGNECSKLDWDYTYHYVEETNIERSNADLDDWNIINSALCGHGDVGFLPRPPERTLFINPDGSRFLNETQGSKSPIKAKISFARRHGLKEEEVMVERVNFEPGSATLKRFGLKGRKSIYVVSTRKQSHLTPSTYYDTDPSFIEKFKDDEWTQEYQYQSGLIYRIPEDRIIPAGSHILSVRDVEKAILAGAEFAEDEQEAFATSFEKLEDSWDDRLKADGTTPMRDIAKLSEEEQAFHATLVSAEFYDFAELLLVDLDNLPKNDQVNMADELRTLLFNEFNPVFENDTWNQLEEAVFIDNLQKVRTKDNPLELARAITGKIMAAHEAFLLSLLEA